mgnify:FL=1
MDTHSRHAPAVPPPGIAIVPMHPDHLDSLADLESLAFSTPWSYDALAEELQNPLAVFLVAEDVDAESAVGYLGMHHILDEGFIANLAVHPAYRRQGIARSLLREAQEYAEAHDLARLTLEVRASNVPAIALYEGMGFTRDGIRPGFYDSPKEDAAIYSYYL